MDVCLCLCVSICACALVITKKINEHVALNSKGKCQLSHWCVYACTVYVHIRMGCYRNVLGMDHRSWGGGERRTGWYEGQCLGFFKGKKRDTDVTERFAA